MLMDKFCNDEIARGLQGVVQICAEGKKRSLTEEF